MNSEIFFQLKTRLKEFGAECRIVSARHLPELESEYNSTLTGVHMDRQFVEESIQNYVDFSVTRKYPSVRSIIVIATPSPQIEVRFNHTGKIHLLKIPPHYSDRLKINANITEITSRVLDMNGYRTFPVVLPKKLLAVRSGLARYGKNNITYVPGMGSYHRLTAFASDFQSDQDSWQGLQMLERCKKCKACQKNCPTGAIRPDRFLLKAERCLTHFNEHLNPFPEWIDPGSHNSIIGCMRCQDICPENMEFRSAAIAAESFSGKETGLILKGVPFEELPEKLQLKIGHLGLQRYHKHLSRNINVLIENQTDP
jgi:epoxyqueuosine reductase